MTKLVTIVFDDAALGKLSKKTMMAVLRKGGTAVEADARRNAPVDTGFLRAGTKARNTKTRPDGTMLKVVQSDARYSEIVHAKTKPYLEEALSSWRPAFG